MLAAEFTPGAEPQDMMAEAIAVLDPVVALLSLVQITGDRTLLAKYGPAIEGAREMLVPATPGQEPPAVDEAAVAKVRELLLAAMRRGQRPVIQAPDRALFHEMARLATGMDVPEPSIPVGLQHAGFVTDTRVHQPERMPPANFKVLVVGAGMIGINAAIKLQQAGYSYQLIEAESDVGGTWLTNTYPGAAVDTESRVYSYSFEPNSAWSRYFPTGPEFLTYLNKVVDKYGIRDKIAFETRVSSAEWNEASSTWTVKAARNGQDVTYEGNFLVMATGPFNGPKFPDLPKLDSFKGRVVHTAAWPADLDLAGKKVVLVGAACSGVQVATAIADQVADLTIVMRQPEYMLPNPFASVRIDQREIYAMDHIPFVAQWKRLQTLVQGGSGSLPDATGLAMLDEEYRDRTGGISPRNDMLRDMCREYIKATFADDPRMVALLTPDYPFFAKRPILDCGYYATLKKPNVHLVKGGIDSATATGLRLTDGMHLEADVILFATGYNTYWGTQFDITGRDGKTLRDMFDPTPFSYWGMMVPGMPNFMIPAGPHSHLTANHAMLGEQQVHYLVELLQEMVDNDLATVEVTDEACKAFLDDTYERIRHSTWANSGTAHGYYRHPSGQVVIAMPRHNSMVWHALRQPRMADYRVTSKSAAAPAPKKPDMVLNI